MKLDSKKGSPRLELQGKKRGEHEVDILNGTRC